MCYISCLFSTLRHGVDALQISIIIIKFSPSFGNAGFHSFVMVIGMAKHSNEVLAMIKECCFKGGYNRDSLMTNWRKTKKRSLHCKAGHLAYYQTHQQLATSVHDPVLFFFLI